MGQVPYGSAATREAFRGAIQHSRASVRVLSERPGALTPRAARPPRCSARRASPALVARLPRPFPGRGDRSRTRIEGWPVHLTAREHQRRSAAASRSPGGRNLPGAGRVGWLHFRERAVPSGFPHSRSQTIPMLGGEPREVAPATAPLASHRPSAAERRERACSRTPWEARSRARPLDTARRGASSFCSLPPRPERA
jgi:hypothetical protein